MRIRSSRNSSLLRRPIFFTFLTILLFPLPMIYGQDGSSKWVFDVGGLIDSSPAIGDEGIIYFGSWDNHLYALQPDGTEKWRFDTGDDVWEPPVVAPDGTIYAGNEEGMIFALNPDGSQKWSFDSGKQDGFTGVMALAADGTLYAAIGGAPNETVFAINPDGTQFWAFDERSNGISIGTNGVIVFGDSSGVVRAVDSLGAQQWEYDIGPAVSNAPAFGEDGTIYVGSNATTNNVAALNPDGTLKWQVTVGSVVESMSTGVNGDIYVPVADSSTSGALVALDPEDGSEKWRFNTNARVQTTPAVGFDGTIYFGTDDEELVAIGPDGTEKWRFETGGDVVSSPTIAPDGTIYFGCDDRNFYALRSSSAGISASSWPKKQGDVRNTGRFGSDVTRRRWFAPHAYWLDTENYTIATIHHTGGTGGTPAGTTAEFRIDVLNRNGSVRFSIEDSIEPGQTKDIALSPPDGNPYGGALLLDAPIKAGTVLAPFLTWQLDVSAVLNPLRIGVFFSDPTDAALVHRFPAEASSTNGLGIGVQNIGGNNIVCQLEFFNADGSKQAEEVLNLTPLGSVADFFNGSVQEGFRGSATFSCNAPVVAVSINQDFANGSFPTDRVTAKGQ